MMGWILAKLRSRWRWIVGPLVGLFVLVAALPSLCQYDPARRWWLRAAFGKVNGEVTVERVSFGWFSPPAIYGLKIVDPQRNPVVTLRAAEGDTPLWRIVTRPRALGTFHFDEPHLFLNLHEDGTTNLQPVFGPLSQPQGDSSPRQPSSVAETLRHIDIGVVIHNAGSSIQTAANPATWKIGALNFAARLVPVGSAGIAPRVEVDGGALLDRTALTTGLCNDLLKFVVPIFADVATAEGAVSVTLAPWQIPLDHPEQSAGGGQLTIHVAKVGAGPLARELAAKFGIVETIEIAEQAEVQFQMQNGRVYHEGLEFGLPGHRIRTSGSVGLDESLDLVAEVPIPQLKGLRVNQKVVQALSGQRLRIPIRGTLEKPKLDVDEFGQSAATLLRGALDRLLDRRRRSQSR